MPTFNPLASAVALELVKEYTPSSSGYSPARRIERKNPKLKRQEVTYYFIVGNTPRGPQKKLTERSCFSQFLEKVGNCIEEAVLALGELCLTSPLAPNKLLICHPPKGKAMLQQLKEIP